MKMEESYNHGYRKFKEKTFVKTLSFIRREGYGYKADSGQLYEFKANPSGDREIEK